MTDLMGSRSAVNFSRIDQRGWLWVGTDAGIVVFDGRIWRRYKADDGLISDETMPGAFLADPDGSVWIGTRGGLSHLQSPETMVQTAPIDLRITRLALGGNRLDAASPPQPWEPNLFFRVHMAQLNGASAQALLHVRLRGLHDDWFETRSHDVQLPALGPGRYTFEAFAVDGDHRRASGLTQWSFEILPPWWRAPWFELAAALACALLMLLAAAWRLARQRQRRLERQRREQEHEDLLVRATRDALTGLWNRPAILDILAREIQSSRESGTPLAVAIIDVDHFKSINDTRGHLAGDEVLRTLGAKLKSRIRAEEALGRYGGEEFLLVMPGATRQRPFLPVERLQRAIAEMPFIYDTSPIKVTASFGVAWLTGPSDTAEKLLSRADAALYGAKHAGRDRVEYAATA
jgi:diguanylate cyclase (GGDEF)-like protein